MSPFGSRSNSFDSCNNDTNKIHCLKNEINMKTAWISIKRRTRDKSIEKPLCQSPSPSPERFLLKMKKM